LLLLLKTLDPLLKNFIHRVPAAVDAEVEKVINGAESFTPDTRMIMGESAEVDGYFIVAGANANSVSLAGGW
jgi:glycine/D-amino acid oxidase-like deaminating enzyme